MGKKGEKNRIVLCIRQDNRWMGFLVPRKDDYEISDSPILLDAQTANKLKRIAREPYYGIVTKIRRGL